MLFRSSKAVLGETMSTTSASAGMGSNQASVHNDVRLEVAKDDADELSETLNATLVRWIVEINKLPGKPPSVSRDFSTPRDLLVLSERDKILCSMGLEPSEKYIAQTYGKGWRRRAPAGVSL